ncbi:carbohydrate ABC transporter permease [Plantactinospora sp. CA-290183]|uniref:carbohydrate ABC transporter permease n=1 Tax=Plantactinospora sp. CA-290183 TaxID=3240006 RepID=UPI003D8AC887
MTGRILRNTAIIVLAMLWLLPTYLMVVNSMTSMSQYEGSPTLWPRGFAFFDNMAAAWSAGDLSISVLNSLGYATVCAAAAVVVATMAGFALVVMPVRRPALWFWLIYSGTLLPLQVFVRPLFAASAETGLYDTHLGLGIVYVAICVPFAFFVVRNYLTTLPAEVTEAGRLDGASWWRLFRSIHLPLSRPAMGAAFIFQFVWVWNELFFGITLTFSPQVRPVMAALAGLQGSQTTVGPPVVLAGALAVSLPG